MPIAYMIGMFAPIINWLTVRLMSGGSCSAAAPMLAAADTAEATDAMVIRDMPITAVAPKIIATDAAKATTPATMAMVFSGLDTPRSFDLKQFHHRQGFVIGMPA